MSTEPLASADETQRLAALDSYDILDTPAEAAFDDIAVLASQICGVPVALISLLDGQRQWFKARVGTDVRETPRDIAFCDHAIRQHGLLEVEDARVDIRFADNPMVVDGPRVRFYAGMPLTTADGHNLGALCVLDAKPNRLTSQQRDALGALARMVIGQLELRRSIAQVRATSAALSESETRYRALSENLETEVRQRTEELARVWENSQDVMVLFGLDGGVRSVNPAMTRTLGWTSDELAGTSILDLIHPDDRPPTEAGRLDPQRYRESRVFKNRLRAKSGAERWFSWAANEAGGVVYLYGRDVTDEVLQAAALAAVEHRLRQSQKMEAVGQLTGGLAHDFNNLLTAITGSLELLELRVRQGRIGEIDRYVVAARAAARRAAALTHRLLAFSRQQTLEPKATDLNRLTHGMEDLISRSVGPSIDIVFVGAPELWPTRVDPNQMENALLNLCINARDAMPEGGRITIETANREVDGPAATEGDLQPGQYVLLSVTDTGTGMTPDVIQRAFDPFFTTKPIGQGTGLGLSMIYGFTRQSGGQIRVVSEPGRGTTMCILLPRDHVSRVADGSARDAPVESSQGSGEVVLIVDDEPAIRMLIADVLHDAGYRSIEASDGSAGLAILQSEVRVDLLITDVGLPGGMNGRQVADAARLRRPALKVLFITGFAESNAFGANEIDPGMQILTKPFSMEQLMAKISAAVENRR